MMFYTVNPDNELMGALTVNDLMLSLAEIFGFGRTYEGVQQYIAGYGKPDIIMGTMVNLEMIDDSKEIDYSS